MSDKKLEEDVNKLLHYYNIVKEKMVPKKCFNMSSKIRREGNDIYASKIHDERSHREVLSLYSMSVALAPNGSEELAMAYGNRSALSFYLKKYKECLIDIERAYQITNSDKLKIKLFDRKTKCLSLIDTSIESGKNIQQDESSRSEIVNNIEELSLNFVASKEIPCAAESISLRYNEKYGRHIIATRDIKSGEIIIVEKNCVSLPSADKEYLICTHCLSSAWTGLPCDCCTFVLYCSEKCKEEAWHQYHNIESSILGFLYFIENLPSSKISHDTFMSFISAVRLFIKAVKKEGLQNIINDVNYLNSNPEMHLDGFFFKGVFQSEKFKSIYNLPRLPEDQNKVYHLIGSIITNILYKTHAFKNEINFKSLSNIDESNIYLFMKNCLIRLTLIVHFNSWQHIRNKSFECFDKIGVTMTPLSSLINHNCASNVCKILMKNSKTLIYANRPIKKGTQVYESYGPFVSHNKSTRQNYLQKNFYFTCDCIACKENWYIEKIPPLFKNNTSRIEVISNYLTEFAQYLRKRTSCDDLDQHENWPCDGETLKRVLILNELIYKHYDGLEAYMRAIHCMAYIETAFRELLGIKYNLPEIC